MNAKYECKTTKYTYKIIDRLQLRILHLIRYSLELQKVIVDKYNKHQKVRRMCKGTDMIFKCLQLKNTIYSFIVQFFYNLSILSPLSTISMIYLQIVLTIIFVKSNYPQNSYKNCNVDTK